MKDELTPLQAWEILQQNADAVLLDVRSSMEYEYVGHPRGAIHMPLMEPPDWQPAMDFAERVRRRLGDQGGGRSEPEARPILALCRSGKRSDMAARLLRQAGFQTVANVLEGFEGDRNDRGHRSAINGWRFHNLPWEQS